MTSRNFTKWEELAEIIDYSLRNLEFLNSKSKAARDKVKELKNRVLSFNKEFPILKKY